MRFWSVIEFGLGLAKETDDQNTHNHFIENFNEVFNPKINPTPDINITETFSEEELKYWSDIFFKLAQMIYERKIGNQEKQDWQATYIYIAYSFGRLFSESSVEKSNK